jgi:hypothetical protein
MADDVTIRFSADTDDLEDGLANVRGAVGSVTPDLKKLSKASATPRKKPRRRRPPFRACRSPSATA